MNEACCFVFLVETGEWWRVNTEGVLFVSYPRRLSAPGRLLTAFR
jgi:hypothetical protein